jgi:FtsH-binding integral membrane protein
MNIQNRLPFVYSALGNLIFQMFVMYRSVEATINNVWLNDIVDRNKILIMVSNVALLLSLIFVKMGIPIKLIVFTLMSISTGMLIHKISDMKEALLEAVAIFVAMLFAGVVTVKMGYNLNTLGLVLFFALIALIFARILSPGKKKYTKIGMLIFALFVVYDTNQILQRNYAGNFVNASLDYFTDILNLLIFASED